MVNEELEPYDARYSRDPSLDPQLVWKGKDEQDKEDLAVPTVPIYRQEHVHPRVLIEEVRASSGRVLGVGGSGGGGQLDLFADFNGIEGDDEVTKLEKDVCFYSHDPDKQKHWTNRMILGDSLLVMNSLAEKEGLRGKVQCIYIDPPYGIKFGSNWQVSTRKRDVKDGKAEDAAREPEVIRAFRDTWKLGIHSYLSYLRDRFRMAQELLTETGSIFVQIGDENVHLVRCLLDEVFGAENLVSQITLKTTSGAGSQSGTVNLASVSSYLLWYGKDIDMLKYRQLKLEKGVDTSLDLYNLVRLSDGSERRISPLELSGERVLPNGARRFRPDNLVSQSPRSDGQFPVSVAGKTYRPGKGYWKTNPVGMTRLLAAGRLRPTAGNTVQYVRFVDDFRVTPIHNVWTDVGTGSFTEEKVFIVQTPVKVVQRCILMTTDPGDLVLDPTCGSGTTAYVAEQWGRRWITIDTSRVALALARTRLMCAKFPYYLLSDSPEGVKKEAELTGQVPPGYRTTGDVSKGFVYKRVPHVTLKSIANNPDIQEGMTREEIDKAIARHADTEYLFDQPFEDNKKVRVTGPFTVESLSPHRILPVDDEGVPTGEEEAKRDDATNDFATMVIENLKKAGVQNTKKGERLVFETLEPFAGRWIQAVGTFLVAGGQGLVGSEQGLVGSGEESDPTSPTTNHHPLTTTKRVAVSIGPEYGAVSPLQIKEAAKEAVQGIGHDVLVVCGYAFDPHVNEETKQIGQLTILPTRMNADLLMGDELLKKTGSGNLFMVFGEPDLEVARVNGQIVVRLRGLDVYDPTTGEIRSNSTNEIACWFIDTNYNGESFFVRHAYFVGAEVTDKKDGQKYDPYRALRSTLKAEIDADAWASIYSTESRAFAEPETGKFAVKVINHYGDEVLKVYQVPS